MKVSVTDGPSLRRILAIEAIVIRVAPRRLTRGNTSSPSLTSLGGRLPSSSASTCPASSWPRAALCCGLAVSDPAVAMADLVGDNGWAVTGCGRAPEVPICRP
jgi:hypothetical protein